MQTTRIMENFDKIEKYLDGEMPFAQRQQMDAEMEADANFKMEFGKHKMAREAMEVMIEDNLRASFDEWDEEGEQSAKVIGINKGAKVRTLYRRIAMAASFLLLAMFGLSWMLSSNYSNENLTAAYYQAPNFSEGRGGNNAETEMSAGVKAFTAGNYKSAAQLFAAIPTNSDRYEEAQYSLGHTQLKLKNYSDAILSFKKVTQGNDQDFLMKGEWNLLLAKLAANQQDAEFETLLNRLVTETDHTFHNQAMELKADLEGVLRKVFH